VFSCKSHGVIALAVALLASFTPTAVFSPVFSVVVDGHLSPYFGAQVSVYAALLYAFAGFLGALHGRLILFTIPLTA
jgi:hypothetical protein